ncbi:MAG: HAMP domain-containing histidine kinase [Bacteroidales bacterium]|nr:HAMP domain-containing histidine kinase [Bacteroidales bacterium]
MKRKLIHVVIILSAVSLIGALITQLLWVRDAWLLKEDQFSSRVKLALKAVVNQLMDNPPALWSESETLLIDSDTIDSSDEIFDVVEPAKLDSLIREEFQGMGLGEAYYYGVFDRESDEVVMGSFGDYSSELARSPHWVSLNCLCQSRVYVLAAFFPGQQQLIFSQMLILPVMSGLFLLVLIFSFFFTIYFLIRQKKLSEMKSDFINSMTHEFRTPLSTILVSGEMLLKHEISQSPVKVERYARIILDENMRLMNQVEKILQAAMIERGNVKLNIRRTDMHEVIRESVGLFGFRVSEKNGQILIRDFQGPAWVMADRNHLSNMINNLIDNAIKYTPSSPRIVLSTCSSGGMLSVSVEDNGIGIRREHQQEIFRQFNRIENPDSHDVKGFGLGLHYVKSMAEAMGGSVTLTSEPGKGSRFVIHLPEAER